MHNQVALWINWVRGQEPGGTVNSPQRDMFGEMLRNSITWKYAAIKLYLQFSPIQFDSSKAPRRVVQNFERIQIYIFNVTGDL